MSDQLSEFQKELRLEHRRQQQRYVYYVIALCVAATGFSVHQTIGQPIKLIQMPLAIAIVCWSYGVYRGFRFLDGSIVILANMNEIFDFVKAAKTRGIEMSTQTVNEALADIVQPKNKKNSIHYLRLMRYFYSGVIFFINWRIAEMIAQRFK